MINREFQGLKLPQLGLGAMRLPVIDNDDARVDEAATAAVVAYAMEQGVNYFDTAYGYHGGHSETALAKALRPYPRATYFLADKFPGYDLGNLDRVEAIFQEQLQRCGVDYFDFYMLHNVCEMNIDAYLDESHGVMAYLLARKQAGQIRHLGFSAHGGGAVMRRFLEAYGARMEFCQLQVNYIDWTFQDAKGKMALLAEYGIPVWVMEPLRGGSLAELAAEDAAKLQALRPGESAVGWAFRFLQTLPGVTVVLSGMSNLAQLADNIQICQTEQPLKEQELAALQEIAARKVAKIALPCTACRYCLSHCPQQLDIPHLIALYNEHCFTGGGFIAPMALQAAPPEKKPSACVACASCEAVCPQQIKIAEAMTDFAAKLA